MELISGIQSLAPEHRSCVATIGNFDGVHRGHQAVIKTLMQASRELRVPATVITFNPLAKEYFAPEEALRLTTVQQRAQKMGDLGVDRMLLIEFNDELANSSAHRFVEEVLINGLGVKYLSVGDDFRFGKGREGGFNYLQQVGKQHDFSVCSHETFKLDGERVSSGRLRQAVKAGDFDAAARLLGEPYTLRGVVEKGQQLGRDLGFPTANIVLDAPRFAVQGVYAVRASTAQHEGLNGVANVGVRPTVDGKENRLEVHLFEFDKDIYGQTLAVEFVEKIRDEAKFTSLNHLKEQIAEDSAKAKQILAKAIQA